MVHRQKVSQNSDDSILLRRHDSHADSSRRDSSGFSVSEGPRGVGLLDEGVAERVLIRALRSVVRVSTFVVRSWRAEWMGLRFSRVGGWGVACLIMVAGLGDWVYVLCCVVVMESGRGRWV